MFEFTVIFNGRIFFKSDRDFVITEERAKEIYNRLKKGFPESEGYKVVVYYWEECAKRITF